jgi:hypothetical protein
MKKAELVGALSYYADRRMGSMKGQDTLARFLAHYFNDLDIPADQKWDFWDIDQYIPQLLLGAFEALRTSEDETVRQFRTRYEKELGQPVADLTDIWGNGVGQALTVQGLGYLFKDAIGADWMADKIDTVFNAERHLLIQVFYKFLDRVFRRGLFQIADECPLKGMSGTFGETNLRTYMIAGRFMLTFARPSEQMEHSVSFVCGVQSVYTDLQTAIAMINDVIAVWPEDLSAQTEILKPDKKVAIG